MRGGGPQARGGKAETSSKAGAQSGARGEHGHAARSQLVTSVSANGERTTTKAAPVLGRAQHLLMPYTKN